jgi:glycine/sarcosine N-methyltransferase
METISAREFYDRLAKVFDVMTNWPERLNYEMPFIEEIFNRHQARCVLDTACGTGWHSITLAKKGYAAAGCDASPAMIEQARTNAVRSQVDVRFEVADFSQLDRFHQKFDALLCLGNSLPHLLSKAKLLNALDQMQARLNPGGLAMFHNLNYDLRLKTRPRFFAVEGNADTLIWRFADYGTDFITFHTSLFERDTSNLQKWSVHVNSTLQKPWLAQDLDHALKKAGFQKMEYFGGLDGSAYDREKSGDVVILAQA